jgi:peptide/nickel transport system substrate-binding protein
MRLTYLAVTGGLLAAVLLSRLSLPASFAQGPKPDSAVHVLVEPEPPMLMLGLNQNGPTGMVAGNIYESLLRYNQKLEPQPSLAKSWEVSDDKLVYIFHLQEGVKWHDGKPFSADDVVFSLDKFLPQTLPRWRLVFNNHVEAIEKIDDLTVRIKLKHPFTPMLLTHLYDGTDYRTNPSNNTPIGTGPFRFSEWKKGSYIHLTKNEDYWIKGKPAISDLYYEIIPDAAARAAAYETGKVEVLSAGSVDVYDTARLTKLPNSCMTTKGAEMFALHGFVTINVRNGILSNRIFRQGLAAAIDRDYVRDVVWNGLGKVPTGPISSKTKYYSSDVPKIVYDPNKAKELIKQAGYKGETFRMLVLPYGEVWNRLAEAIKQNLTDVGVNVEIENTDVAGWTQKTGNGDFDLGFTNLYQNGDPAIGVARSYLTSNIVKGNPLGNSGGYSNPEVDKLFALASGAKSDAEAQGYYTKLQQIVVDDMPDLWLLEIDMPTIYRCNIKNLITTAIGVNDAFRDAVKE